MGCDMLLHMLGAGQLARLMACGDRPGFSGPDLSWLLYGPDTEAGDGGGASLAPEVISQKNSRLHS